MRVAYDPDHSFLLFCILESSIDFPNIDHVAKKVSPGKRLFAFICITEIEKICKGGLRCR